MTILLSFPLLDPLGKCNPEKQTLKNLYQMMDHKHFLLHHCDAIANN